MNENYDGIVTDRFGAETAGRLAVADIPRFPVTDTVATVREILAATRFEIADIVVIVDDDGGFRGAVELQDLLHAKPDTRLSELANVQWPTVGDSEDQEIAADIAVRSGMAAPVVLDARRGVTGCIPPVVLMGVLVREHREDLHKLAGVLHDNDAAIHALEDPPLVRASRRLPWLMTGLGLSAATALVMSSFEATMEANIMVAFFLPSLVYLSDAIGAQSVAVAVRGLSLRRKPLQRILRNELATGALIGFVLAVLAIAGVMAMFGHPLVAIGVGLSLLAAGTLASTIGLILPWTLSRFGIDPAFGSGPVATIIHDMLTIVLYLSIMTVLLA